MKKLFEDFRKFAVKGNVMDLAVGVIIGSAFGKITSSLVNDIMMPLLSIVIGKINLTTLSITLMESGIDGNPIVLKYGMFLQTILEFFIIAFSVFLFLRYMNKLLEKAEALKKEHTGEEEKKKEEDKTPKLTKSEEILIEIRDLMKDKEEK